MCGRCNVCYRKVEIFLSGCFGKYGRLVAGHPWVFIMGSVLMSGCLGLGLIRLQPESGIEAAYTPRDSEALHDREYIYDTYPESSVANFTLQTLPNLGLFGDIIVKSKDESNILSSTNLDVFEKIYHSVMNITVQSDIGPRNYIELCARTDSGCSVSGSFVFTLSFKEKLSKNSVKYPFDQLSAFETAFLPFVLGDVVLNDGAVSSAKYIRIRLHLRQDGDNAQVSKTWLQKFKTHMNGVKSETLDLTFAHSDSMEEELDANTQGDLLYISLTFTLMIWYATLAISGGNCVSSRRLLANAGVLSTGLAILGSMGLLSACGVKFVNIVGVVPFLVMGVGVDDMFILLSGLAEVQHLDTVEDRVSETMRSAGLAITITSLTSTLAFTVGSISVFLVVQNFCLYTGVAVIFCYLNQMTFFTGCMTLHERRVLANRHGTTCMVTQSREEMIEDGKSKGTIICCSGSPPLSREDIEGFLERYPRLFLRWILQYRVVRILTLFVFAVYLGFSIWGAIQVEEGLILKNTVSKTSYYYEYETFLSHLSSDHFVSFVFRDDVDYWNISVRDEIKNLVSSAQELNSIRDNYSMSWLEEFTSSAVFDDSSKETFTAALHIFLEASATFVNDVVIINGNIVSSRVHVVTENIRTTNAQAALMINVRKVADVSPLPVIAYCAPFIFYEQYTAILPSTLRTIGIALPAVVVATFLFMPHVVIMLYVLATLVMILVGVFGFMYFWGITLSSITMILLIMSVGFAIDYSIHTSHAFIQSNKPTRLEKMTVAVNMAAAPILNAALSSCVGILMLILSESYIFQTFFKIMLLVIVLGFVHSTFFLPSLLSFFGPLDSTKYMEQESEREMSSNVKRTHSRASVSPVPSQRRGLQMPRDSSSDIASENIFYVPRPTVTSQRDHSDLREATDRF